MATSYLSPGVYIEETPSPTKAIAGVGTNTVGFIGIVDDTVDYPEFLADAEYQKRLKEAQDKLYGSDDDYSDKTIKSRVEKADAEAKKARLEWQTPKEKFDAKDGPKAAAAKAQRQFDNADEAGKPAAKADLDAANAAQDAALKQLAELDAAATAAEARAKTTAQEVAELLKEAKHENRIAAAKRNARQAARASVSRYEPKTFAIKVQVGQAKLCTNFTEFQNRFGPWSSYPKEAVTKSSADMPLSGHQILSHAVYGFFNNGGRRCFIARVRQDNLADDLDKALEAFESVESISLIAFPGSSSDSTISSALVAHCEKTKYRFAILDAPASPVDDQGVLDLQQLTYDSPKPALPFRTKHAAVYFPYIEVVDPALQLQQANLEAIPSKYKGLVCIPPSGAMAGIYARTDVERGVFKAPANASVLGAQNVKYYISRNAQEGLNPQGVNCIRTMNGDITVWGARTCGGDENNEWRYVNVRRTFLFIAKSIDEGTQWVVFEPNDYTLWGKVRRNVSAFLNTVWRQGALFGETPEEAFYVKCDAENNPPETREVGQLVIEIGISIVKPAEFVIFKITQGSSVGPAA